MASYYKYADTIENSQVNWAEIGKGITDMLSKETERREKLKESNAAIQRQSINNLLDAPQGKFQDGNKFINDYTSSASDIMLENYRLLTSGRMTPKEWTLRTQNINDGTKRLFELQNTYQKVYDDRMKGVQSGDLQALNAWMMASVEGFADFSKSRGIINPIDNTVNIGMMAPNKDGVMELTKDVMPVSVAMGKLLTPIQTFKVYDSLAKAKASLGTNIDSIYRAATTSKAGTITKLLGVGAQKGYEQFKPAVDEFNKGMDNMVASFFTNKYNITSVLTENTGKYSSESFTYDKDLAKKDPSKILMKIDPASGIPIIDPSGTHYEEQKKEAGDWVKTQFVMMLDKERTVQTTSQTQAQYAPEYVYARGEQAKNDVAAATMIGKLWGAKTDAELQEAAQYFRDNYDKGVAKIKRSPDEGVVVYYSDGRPAKPVSFKGGEGTILEQKAFIRSAAPLLTGITDINKAIEQGGFIPNATFSNLTAESSVLGAAPQGDYSEKVYQDVKSKGAKLIYPNSTPSTVNAYTAAFGKLGFTFGKESTGKMRVTAPDKTSTVVTIDKPGADEAVASFMSGNQDSELSAKMYTKGQGTVSGGNVR